MQRRHLLLPLLVTSSLFLVHCSSGDDDSGGQAGTGGPDASGGSTSGSAGTGTAAGTGGGGSAGTSATGGGAGTSAKGGQGGTSGPAAGQGGGGGAMAGRGSAGASGSAGKGAGAGGIGSGGMSGGGGSGGAGTSGAVGAGAGGNGAAGGGGTGGTGSFTLTSTAIMEGGMFPADNTCAGANTSPDLTWTAGPSGTMSYAVILFDTSNSLNHWVLWDIPASVTSLPAMLDKSAMLTMPAGAKQKAISGNGYYGPCPNGADHVYKFTVYALPVATLSGAMTSSQTSALSMAVTNANPLASASVSAHSSAKMMN